VPPAPPVPSGIALLVAGCAACASPAPSLVASPGSLDLGTVMAGELGTGGVWLAHAGDDSVTITDVTLSDPDRWSAALLDPTVDPGQRERLTLGVVGQGPGTLDAQVMVTTSDGATLTVPLTAGILAADVPAESVDGPELFSWDRTRVHELTLNVSADGIDALRSLPTDWVSGSVTYNGQTWDPVALRLKGSASFQTIDAKPAWKIKFGEYVDGQTFHGLERLTLNNEVWDSSMMAETMAYWTWRDNGAPAPRTTYASVTLNGELLGLYAVLESMDDDFMDHMWPGSNGGLYEMTRSCDFTGDCTCFELQETGSAYDPDGLTRGCEAVAIGTVDALKDAFDWDAIIRFLAVELSVNHPDSYSFNLNNFFVYHDPLADKLSVSPWGADSTFTYVYPPSSATSDCERLYAEVLGWSSAGWWMTFCRANETCRADLEAQVLAVADWMERSDLAGAMADTRVLLDPHAELETWVNWTVEDRAANIDCMIDWTGGRPETLRVWVEGP